VWDEARAGSNFDWPQNGNRPTYGVALGMTATLDLSFAIRLSRGSEMTLADRGSVTAPGRPDGQTPARSTLCQRSVQDRDSPGNDLPGRRPGKQRMLKTATAPEMGRALGHRSAQARDEKSASSNVHCRKRSGRQKLHPLQLVPAEVTIRHTMRIASKYFLSINHLPRAEV